MWGKRLVGAGGMAGGGRSRFFEKKLRKKLLISPGQGNQKFFGYFFSKK
jgi:hypothetical protein